MDRKSLRNVKREIVISAVALTTMGRTAWAAIPSANGTIKGRYARTSGRLLSFPVPMHIATTFRHDWRVEGVVQCRYEVLDGMERPNAWDASLVRL